MEKLHIEAFGRLKCFFEVKLIRKEHFQYFSVTDYDMILIEVSEVV